MLLNVSIVGRGQAITCSIECRREDTVAEVLQKLRNELMKAGTFGSRASEMQFSLIFCGRRLASSMVLSVRWPPVPCLFGCLKDVAKTQHTVHDTTTRKHN